MPDTTYLELSEQDGSAHKFYEVAVDGVQMTVRYGRIGEGGQVKTTTYASADKARAEADRKLGEKLRKGYQRSVPGVRQKRPVTRRVMVSTRSTANQAPVLWKFASGAPAFGIFVDAHRSMVGNERGQVSTLTPDGQVTGRFQLPDGVKCIVADEGWLYAGCDDGNVYDLSGKVPRLSYQIAPDVDIYWLDICGGVLGVADADGGIAVINHEDEFQWRRRGTGSSGWMVRCDPDGVYHGHSRGVQRYDWETGQERWHRGTRGGVLFGWQERDTVYAGTSGHVVHAFGKDGTPGPVYACDAAVFSCAAAPDGRFVFAGDNCSSVYCFDAAGRRLWKLATGCGSAYSMQYAGGRLYLVTTDGSLACIDASEEAIRAAQAGTVPAARDVKAPASMPAVAPSQQVDVAVEAGDGVVVECTAEGGALRVRVVSPGYRQDYRVQFPKNVREAGTRYVVDGVRESGRGGFYRAYGEIRRLDG